MKFNLWLVIFLALMPVFLLFTGLSAAAAFQSSVEWKVIGMVIGTAIAAGYLATRRGSEISEETSRVAKAEELAPAFRRSFDEQECNAIGRTMAVRTTSSHADKHA